MKKILRRTRICLLLAMAWLLMVIAGHAMAAHAEAIAAAASPPVAIDLTDLINAAIAVLCALITGRLVPWIKANTAQKQQAALQAACDIAVYAAQQLYKSNVIQDRLDYAERWLEGRGYTASRADIEAAVRRMDSAKDIFVEGVELSTDVKEVKDSADH